MSLYTIKEETLNAIGDAIREKNGSDEKYGSGDFAAAILAITSGVDLELPPITGEANYLFEKKIWQYFLVNYGEALSTEDLTDTSNMFRWNPSYYKLDRIPFELNYKTDEEFHNIDSILYMPPPIKEFPKFNNCRPKGINKSFELLINIREMPEDVDSWFDWSYVESNPEIVMNGAYRSFYSLRSAPANFGIHAGTSLTDETHSPYAYRYNCCISLDEVIGLPIIDAVKTADDNVDLFYGMLDFCHRLKNFTFETNPDGSPITVNWSGQRINFVPLYGVSSGFLFHPVGVQTTNVLPMKVISYNSGITEDKKIYDDATYAALKNDPDNWTDNYNYSRYNHDSAVRTINSLPDASAHLTETGLVANTVVFMDDAGALTDGGSIGSLTDSEIAVAAAKGWTVSLL